MGEPKLHVHPATSLAETADKKETRVIQVNFDEVQMRDLSSQLANNSVTLANYSEELNRIKAEFKAKMDPIVKENGRLVEHLRTGFEEKKIQVFGFANHDTGMMEFYDEHSTLVDSRRLLPEERQIRLM